MSEALRYSLWNVLSVELWEPWKGYRLSRFGRILEANFFKRPIDTTPYDPLPSIREFFLNCEWYRVFDFLEFVVSSVQDAHLVRALNKVLERELSGYRFVAGQVVDITSEQETEMLEETLSYGSQFVGVDTHLQQALSLYASREEPDYRNSIKESISAVECMARIVSGEPKATLGDALKPLEKKGLHKALKGGFSKLYGYTNDADGIRHAMMDKPNLTAADARYFLLSCTSFINYLKTFME